MTHPTCFLNTNKKQWHVYSQTCSLNKPGSSPFPSQKSPKTHKENKKQNANSMPEESRKQRKPRIRTWAKSRRHCAGGTGWREAGSRSRRPRAPTRRAALPLQEKEMASKLTSPWSRHQEKGGRSGGGACLPPPRGESGGAAGGRATGPGAPGEDGAPASSRPCRVNAGWPLGGKAPRELTGTNPEANSKRLLLWNAGLSHPSRTSREEPVQEDVPNLKMNKNRKGTNTDVTQNNGRKNGRQP